MVDSTRPESRSLSSVRIFCFFPLSVVRRFPANRLTAFSSRQPQTNFERIGNHSHTDTPYHTTGSHFSLHRVFGELVYELTFA